MEMNMIPDTREEMLRAEFWINKLNDRNMVIMSEEEILKFNQKNAELVDEVYDLKSYKEELTGEELKSFINSYTIPEAHRYDINGARIKEEFYKELAANTNLGDVKDANRVRYGITVRNTSVRSFPDDRGVFKTAEDIEFDRFQETGCQALEPVLILHTSRDGKWYFVQMYNYRGWVKSEDVAEAENKDQVFDFIDSKDFIVVKGDFIFTQNNPHERRVSSIRLEMGTRIPLEINPPRNVGNQSTLGNYVVKYPVRNMDGTLSIKHALISKLQDISEGYLPYTRANILTQAFKLFGHRYGWGDSLDGRDCSSTLMFINKSFGLRLPRNGNEQEEGAGISYKFDSSTTLEERNKTFDMVKPGAAIFMPGHVMMYIGKDGGVHYMIHCFSGYGEKVGEEYKTVPVNEMAVTSTLLRTSSGNLFINKFTSLLQYE